MSFQTILDKYRKNSFSERDILGFLLSVLHVSVQTVELVSQLPKVKFK